MTKDRRAGRNSGWTGIALLAIVLVAVAASVATAGPEDGKIKRKVVVKTDDGEHAFLGVHLSDDTDREEGGALISGVVEEAPAEEAGLEEGDVIIRFDGESVKDPSGLTRRIHAHKPGDTVSITVVRDGREKKFDVKLGERSSNVVVLPHLGDLGDIEWYDEEGGHGKLMAEHLEQLGDPENWSKFGRGMAFKHMWGRPRLGVELVETTSELRSHLGGSESAGILVGKVLPGTPAERAGVKVGDLIVTVGGEEVADVDELREALDEKEGESFSLEVVRERKRMTLQVTIPEPEDDRPSGPRAAVDGGEWTPRPAAAPRAPRSEHSRHRALMAPPPPPAAPTPPAPPAPPTPPAFRDRSV